MDYGRFSAILVEAVKELHAKAGSAREQGVERCMRRSTARLEALQREYDTGQTMLAELDAKQLDLRQTLLRISGAIQVLQELIADEAAPASGVGAAGIQPGIGTVS